MTTKENDIFNINYNKKLKATVVEFNVYPFKDGYQNPILIAVYKADKISYHMRKLNDPCELDSFEVFTNWEGDIIDFGFE